jgi:chromosome segregation ATPase
MSVQRKSSPSAPESDLESTAELPVLDVAAYEAAAEARSGNTDTWIIQSPVPTDARPPAGDTVVMPALDANAASARGGSPGEEKRTPLEVSLHAFSDNLREVEERLRAKGERLIEMEKALAQAHAERAVVEHQSRQLTAELTQARAAAATAEARVGELQRSLEEREAAPDQQFEGQLDLRDRALALIQKDLTAAQALAATYLESLRSNEGRRGLFQELSTSLHREVEERATRINTLEGQLADLGARSQQLASQLGENGTRIAGLEKDLVETNAALTQRDAALRDSVATGDDLKRNAATLTESLMQRDERIRALEEASSTAQRYSEEGDAVNAQLRKRIEQLEAESVMVRAELQQRSVALEEAATARGEHMARIAAGEAQVEDLQSRMQEQHEFVRVLQADSNASVARVKELEGDLRAAEDMIHRLEADLRNRNARLEEMERTNQEWRATVAEARTALTDRDSLIRRLEEETANSAVLLGAIQQRLDSSGVHEVAPEGDKRLLIRSEGDSDVVHVLGRKTSVGRTPDNDLQIDAKFISRHHAVILAGPAHTIIEDLNSTNGVLVNGRRITRQTLKDGDSVVIGKTLFRFAVRPAAERRG